MNKDEYIIINKTAIQKRIEELEIQFKGKVGYNMALGEIESLKQILSQSTPLIPEIEKACKEANKQFFNQT
jgi:hypothetical protein